MRKLFVVLLLAAACQSRNDVATTQSPSPKPVDRADPWSTDRSAPPPATTPPSSTTPSTGYEARTAGMPTRSTDTTPSSTGMTSSDTTTPTTSAGATSSDTTTTSTANTTTPMTDDAWANARQQFSTDMKSRMDSLDARISQLETEAHNLRVEKDQIAKQLSGTSDQTRESWEHFKADVRAALSRLETELDARR